jgi:hypothetical protein
MSRVVAKFDREVNDGIDIDPHQAWKPDQSAKFGAAVGTPQMMAATLSAMNINTESPIAQLGAFYASTIPFGKSGFLRTPIGFQPWYVLSKKTKDSIKQNTNELIAGLRMAGASEVFGNGESPSISTVHIFGSLPLAANGILDKRGYVKETGGKIRVSDGSLLPTAPFVNPQGPLLHLTNILAKNAYS